jgi:hypothetical protein
MRLFSKDKMQQKFAIAINGCSVVGPSVLSRMYEAGLLIFKAPPW